MKKETKIIKTGEQLRNNIPKTFVDKFKVTNKDKISWDDKGNKLKGELIRESKQRGTKK